MMHLVCSIWNNDILVRSSLQPLNWSSFVTSCDKFSGVGKLQIVDLLLTTVSLRILLLQIWILLNGWPAVDQHYVAFFKAGCRRFLFFSNGAKDLKQCSLLGSFLRSKRKSCTSPSPAVACQKLPSRHHPKESSIQSAIQLSASKIWKSEIQKRRRRNNNNSIWFSTNRSDPHHRLIKL